MVANEMMYGKTKDEIIEDLIENYGYSVDGAELVYSQGERRLQQKMSELNISAAEKHSKMLNAIADEAYEAGNLNIALKAIDILNRTKQVYSDTIKLETEAIKIKFDK